MRSKQVTLYIEILLRVRTYNILCVRIRVAAVSCIGSRTTPRAPIIYIALILM